MKRYIQPFERNLALAELASMAQSEPQPLFLRGMGNILDYEVTTDVPPSTLANRLAYWESIFGDSVNATTQSLREATVNIVRNGISPASIAKLVPFGHDVPFPNRRCLRYGPHGIHEYRGKFFPQLVRALMNMAEVPIGGIVADPMSGSGTTIVEAILSGINGIGLDMNPLSVLMGQTKCALLSVQPDTLTGVYEQVRDNLLSSPFRESAATLTYFSSLPATDQEYLSAWFSEQVLLDLDQIATVIHSINDTNIRDLMRLSLSNIIRSVSWQKNDDLRVRREQRDDVDIDPIKEFLEELSRSVRMLLAFLYQNQGSNLASHDIRDGDARRLTNCWDKQLGTVDAVITSPPYATALPYLDTDRLSLCYLGLLPRPEHRKRDQQMIGNREISDKQRQSYWEAFRTERGKLPESVAQLIERIECLNSTADVGFRRRNLPALLAKYFCDMYDVFGGIAHLLKPGGKAYVVVGNNHTIAGGQKVDIETAKLLIDTAVMVGLEASEHIPMEMLSSRDIFKKNAVASEVILSFRRAS